MPYPFADDFADLSALMRAVTGAPADLVTDAVHDLYVEATGATLSRPIRAQVDRLTDDLISPLVAADLPAAVMADHARNLHVLRARSWSGRAFYIYSRLLGRVRQQQVVAAVPGLTRLAPARSQAEAYTYGPDGRVSHVWYACYGSNLYLDRMNVYITGGTPNGGRTVYTGARDKTPIAGSEPIALPGTVHYAGESAVWTGGVGFLDPRARGHSLGRAHLITAAQFDDVVYQESHGAQAPDGTPVALNTVLAYGRVIEPGLYSTLHHVGDHEGVPVVTFTGPFATRDALRGDLVLTSNGLLSPARSREQVRAAQQAAVAAEQAAAAAEGRDPAVVPTDWPIFTSPPSTAYRAMIGGGLAETHGLTQAQIDLYFDGATGVHTPVRHPA